jgi:hypothetical protein
MGLEEIRKLKEQALLPKQKKVYKIPKMSKKMIEKKLDESGKFKANAELEKWFQDRRREDSGICNEPGCTTPTYKFNSERWKFSLCHIIKKSTFPSVATHPYNCIHLCFTHHQIFDAGYSVSSKMGVWALAKKKFEFFRKEIKERHKDLDWFE